MARNDSLNRFLENRPKQEELEKRNILHAKSEDGITSSRKENAVKLGRKLSMRPTAEELEQRNILHGQSDVVMLTQSLAAHRPALLTP